MDKVLLFDNARGCWLSFAKPVRVITTRSREHVVECLEQIENEVETQHRHAVGFLSYEAGAAFDDAFPRRDDDAFPLLCFGLFEEYETLRELPPTTIPEIHWRPGVSEEAHAQTIDTLRAAIARGETYQVNYTFPFSAASAVNPEHLFQAIAGPCPPPYAAFLDLPEFAIACFSPELFLDRDGDRLTSRPMKGTAPRGRTLDEDDRQAAQLQSSPKERAENVMIVDMIRNDMGRIARTGTVNVEQLFEVHRFPTLLQLTSTVSCRTEATMTQILKAMFPCASITGAPKAQTMRIIQSTEPRPRRLYTGAIGHMEPGRKARFNVAIRTVLIDKTARHMTYGVGGGIVWDSQAHSEYQECLLKAKHLCEPSPDFSLLETVLWEPGPGYFLLEEHVNRLQRSAQYFNIGINEAKLRDRLQQIAITLTATSRIRLVIDRKGAISHTVTPAPPSGYLRLAIAPHPIHSGNPFLYHKTTHRLAYEQAAPPRTDVDDQILWNERGEITETTIGNLVFQNNGQWFTPPLESGLLPGVFREKLLAEGKIQEAIILLKELSKYSKLFRINSVRRWEECRSWISE